MPVHANGKWSNNFTPTVKRFRNQSTAINDASLRKTVASLSVGAVKEARANLKKMVYNAPLPRSVTENGLHWTAEAYIAKRRLGIVWNACKANRPKTLGPGVVMASAEVDRSAVEGNENTHEAFYYAYILNKGSTNNMVYEGRPFWTNMTRTMRNRMREFALTGLKNSKVGLLGFDGWQYSEEFFYGGAI